MIPGDAPDRATTMPTPAPAPPAANPGTGQTAGFAAIPGFKVNHFFNGRQVQS